MNEISTRSAAASGAFYVVAVFAGSALTESRSPGLADAALVLVVLGFLALVVFIGYLHTALRRAEGPGGWLATAALVAGALHAASRFDLLASELGTDAAPSGAADILDPLNEYGPRWLAWIGVVAGTITVVIDLAAVVDSGWWSPWPLVATGLWLFVLSGLLAVTPHRSAGEPARTDLVGAV